ncbi:unnamed protein product [Tuber aestivum]|uniref:CCHC-type domain-containing protein n=1 Tax=Tuber aestivum TaxID=59557 RepID=A0A292PV15_9PEZI|nr:unnamed protein product [Tuber aestivum]
MERNYTAAVRAINADSRKRHRSQLEVVIPCPPPKPDKGSEDFISLNFESEYEDGSDGDDESGDDDRDKADNAEYSLSEDLKTTQTSMSEEDKRDESEGGISERTRFKRRRKGRSDRKDGAVEGGEVGEEAMKAVARSEGFVAANRSEGFVAANRSVGQGASTVTIEIKSSSSSPSGGAYQHEDDEDKDSATRKAQQQRQQKPESTAAPFSSCSAITATGPLSLPSSTQTRAAGSSTNATSSSPNPKPQSVTKGSPADIPQGREDLSSKVVWKLAKKRERKERRRVERTCRKAALKQKKASIGHPRVGSFGSVPSDINAAREKEKEDEGLEINLALEEEGGGLVGAKEEEEEEDYISLSITKAPIFTTDRRGIPSSDSSSLSSSLSPFPATASAIHSSGNSDSEHGKHRESPILIDHKTAMFQLRYYSTTAPPLFVHEESRPLFAPTKGITAASFRLDTGRFEEPEGPGKGITMETIVCDCEHCGAWDKHFSNACPELPTGEISLKDYNWRKFPQAAPSPSQPTTTTAARTSPTSLHPIRANCYHCSGTEHFGDDCPFLPPLSHPGIFSLSGINDGDYASQEWLCEKQDLLAELEGKRKKPVYGRAIRPGDYGTSEEFDPFGEYRALERERDRDGRRDVGGGGEMMMGRRRPGERSPPHRRGIGREIETGSAIGVGTGVIEDLEVHPLDVPPAFTIHPPLLLPAQTPDTEIE